MAIYLLISTILLSNLTFSGLPGNSIPHSITSPVITDIRYVSFRSTKLIRVDFPGKAGNKATIPVSASLTGPGTIFSFRTLEFYSCSTSVLKLNYTFEV